MANLPTHDAYHNYQKVNLSWVQISSVVPQVTNLAYEGIGAQPKDALRSDSPRLSTYGLDTPVKSANSVERRTSLAFDFSPALSVGAGAKAVEPQCQLSILGSTVTDHYSLVRSSTSGANKGPTPPKFCNAEPP